MGSGRVHLLPSLFEGWGESQRPFSSAAAFPASEPLLPASGPSLTSFSLLSVVTPMVLP